MLDHLNMLFLSYQSINYSVNKQLIRFVISIMIIINFKRKLQTTNKSQPQLGAANMTHKSPNDYTQCFGTKKNYTIFMFQTRYDLLNFQLIIPSMYVVRCCSWFVAPDINRDGSDHLNTRTHLFMQISCIFAEIKKNKSTLRFEDQTHVGVSAQFSGNFNNLLRSNFIYRWQNKQIVKIFTFIVLKYSTLNRTRAMQPIKCVLIYEHKFECAHLFATFFLRFHVCNGILLFVGDQENFDNTILIFWMDFDSIYSKDLKKVICLFVIKKGKV